VASESSVLEEFKGTYRGLNLSFDESPVLWGEAEVVIDDEQVILRGASGIGINWESRDLGRARELSEKEVAAEKPDDIQSSQLRIFAVGSLLLFFNLTAKENEAVLIPQNSRAIIGGLFSPKQVEQGQFDAKVKLLETQSGIPGGFPLLELGGYAPINAGERLS
jgi:hypothetical protein